MLGVAAEATARQAAARGAAEGEVDPKAAHAVEAAAVTVVATEADAVVAVAAWAAAARSRRLSAQVAAAVAATEAALTAVWAMKAAHQVARLGVRAKAAPVVEMQVAPAETMVGRTLMSTQQRAG